MTLFLTLAFAIAYIALAVWLTTADRPQVWYNRVTIAINEFLAKRHKS